MSDIITPPIDEPAINRNGLYLHPELFKRLQRLIAECTAKGLTFGVFEGWRSPRRQADLFASGRTKPGAKLTNAEPWQSYHQYGLAADMVLDGDQRKPGYQWSWAESKHEYDTMGALAEKCGLAWAGRWKRFPEKPHVELTFGFKAAELREMYSYHRNLTGVWQEIDAARPATITPTYV